MTVEQLGVFKVGGLYSNQEVSSTLGVGNAGGVRANSLSGGGVRRLVVMTARPSARQALENPYHDRVEGSVLVYTGAGREGDQALGGVNRRFPEQVDTPFPIYGFQLIASRRDRTVGPRRWEFLGLMEYLRHYREHQIDARGEVRNVWIFELRIHSEPAVVSPQCDESLSAEVLQESRSEAAQDPADRDVGETPIPALDAGSAFTQKDIEVVRRRLLTHSPEEFEKFVASLLSASGYERVCVTKFSQDGGIDVNARAGPTLWPIQGQLIQVQAKRWLHTVGRREVAELRGSLQPHAHGAVVTTSYYSRAAMREASESGKLPITLVDGQHLSWLALRGGLVEVSGE